MSEDIFKNGDLQGVLQQVAGQLKGSLGNIYSALDRIAPAQLRDESSQLDQDAAVLCQSYYRILRLANNLADAAHLTDISAGKYEARIDLKPALEEKTLDARIRSDFEKYRNRDFLNALDDLLPQKMIAPFVRLCEIDGRKKVHSVTREERERMVRTLKQLTVPLKGLRPIDEAIVTRGGVSVKEVHPKTMGSKLVSGLYFAGELLDLDAYTGGFNLQIAFSTGVVAGQAAALGE